MSRYSRLVEGHRRMDAMLVALGKAWLGHAEEGQLHMVEAVLDLEMSRFVNSGEIHDPDEAASLDGALSSLCKDFPGRTDPLTLWFWRRRGGIRLTDNTTPPMFVLRFRAQQVCEHFDESYGNREPDPVIAFRDVIGEGSRIRMGLDVEITDPLEYARQWGLLPYEVDIILSEEATPTPIPRDLDREYGFLMDELRKLFPNFEG